MQYATICWGLVGACDAWGSGSITCVERIACAARVLSGDVPWRRARPGNRCPSRSQRDRHHAVVHAATGPHANPLAELSPRELQTLSLLAQGKPYGRIAEELG